jgi:hypothetical protein
MGEKNADEAIKKFEIYSKEDKFFFMCPCGY